MDPIVLHPIIYWLLVVFAGLGLGTLIGTVYKTLKARRLGG